MAGSSSNSNLNLFNSNPIAKQALDKINKQAKNSDGEEFKSILSKLNQDAELASFHDILNTNSGPAATQNSISSLNSANIAAEDSDITGFNANSQFDVDSETTLGANFQQFFKSHQSLIQGHISKLSAQQKSFDEKIPPFVLADLQNVKKKKKLSEPEIERITESFYHFSLSLIHSTEKDPIKHNENLIQASNMMFYMSEMSITYQSKESSEKLIKMWEEIPEKMERLKVFMEGMLVSMFKGSEFKLDSQGGRKILNFEKLSPEMRRFIRESILDKTGNSDAPSAKRLLNKINDGAESIIIETDADLHLDVDLELDVDILDEPSEETAETEA